MTRVGDKRSKCERVVSDKGWIFGFLWPLMTVWNWGCLDVHNEAKISRQKILHTEVMAVVIWCIQFDWNSGCLWGEVFLGI